MIVRIVLWCSNLINCDDKICIIGDYDVLSEHCIYLITFLLGQDSSYKSKKHFTKSFVIIQHI